MKLTLPVLLVLCPALYASSVITTTCDGIVSADHCHSEIPAGFGSTSRSSASGSVTLQLAADPAGWSNLMTHQEAFSQQGYPIPPAIISGPGTSASVSIDYSQDVITAGPQRAGYLQINLGQSGGGYFYDGHAEVTSGFTITPYGSSVSAPYTEIHCVANGNVCGPGNGYYGYYNRIPVTLGTPLTLEANGRLANQAVGNDASSGGNMDTSFLFRFFEDDRVTPVGVELVADAPEPSTYGLITLSLTGAVLLRRKLATS